MTDSRWTRTAAVSAAIAAVFGLAACGGDDSDTTAGAGATTVPTEAPATTAAAGGPSTSPSTVAEEVGPFGAAEELPTGFTGLQAVTYWTDSLGAPFSFEIGQSLYLQENRATSIALSSPASRDPGDKDMVFRPLSVLWSPLRIGATDGDASAAGLVAHLESLAGRVVVSNVTDVTVGGRDAIRLDVEVDTSACGADTEPCQNLLGTESGLLQTIEPGWTQRIWVIGEGDDALTVTAGIWTDRDEVWLDVIDGYVATMTFADDS